MKRTAATDSPTERPASPPLTGWRQESHAPSLPEVHASISVAHNGFWRKLLAFSGPGLMVAVGYMDPGNWATDLEGGARFGYTLLSVVLISNFMAILLQHLSLKLGIVSGRDLAQACRDHYSPGVAMALWALCEVAIAACDLAEVIGSAIALKLLFGIPLTIGVMLTALDVVVVLFLQHKGFRYIEALVASLIVVIGLCFLYEIIAASPDLEALVGGLVPQPEIVTNPGMLYVAIGILGATVMPHNLYLHSSIVQTRAFERNDEGKKTAIRFATIDSTVALGFAFFINAAILIVSAATFYNTSYANVETIDINEGYLLLQRVLGPMASTVFALALLASGQNSTLTGTMAGQIVMEGFLNLRLRPWVRRLLTRMVAIVPAVVVAVLYGEHGEGALLVLSQVVLSMQLSFAVIPLVQFTSDRRKMGAFANSRLLSVSAWIATAIIVSLNLYLLVSIVGELALGG